jgi:hypothetical protein
VLRERRFRRAARVPYQKGFYVSYSLTALLRLSEPFMQALEFAELENISQIDLDIREILQGAE